MDKLFLLINLYNVDFMSSRNNVPINRFVDNAGFDRVGRHLSVKLELVYCLLDFHNTLYGVSAGEK